MGTTRISRNCDVAKDVNGAWDPVGQGSDRNAGEETGSEPLGDTKGNALATSICAQKDALHDEGSYVAKLQEMDLIIARGGTKGEASESYEDSLGNDEREEVMWVRLAVVEAPEAAEEQEAAEAPNPPEMKKSKKICLLLYPVGQQTGVYY
ncbi:hypothetical protein Scep_026433 [Stephania cephalantha]|uniref:Uncharacterized protein n=1 Tax=Stephania cephalantha TaxID=152367 RepID=A0AAP0HQE0_9MAGN